MNNKIDWIIHLVVNGVACADCKKRHYEFLPYTCNVHTHGMEKYGHLDFQIVLELSQKMQMYILNTLGLRVQAGEKFKAGDIVSEICQGYDLKLVEAREAERTVLRVLIPDEAHKFPDDEGCDKLYALQSLPTEELQVPDENPIIRLYQISCDHPNHRDCIYESSSYVKNKYGAVPSEMYECVFAGVFDLHTPEDIFHVFNNRHPLGYTGRSMSVSDVVEFEYSNGKRAFYYCNSAGFEMVEFDLDKIIRKNLS